MITEDYVSYEIAKLLKEKGFDIECNTAYYNGSLIDYTLYGFCDGELINCPTHQMAMKWLRRIHNINIDIVSVWNQKRFEYQVFVVTPENAKRCYVDTKLYLGYEEAVESAIKYCLENLI